MAPPTDLELIASDRETAVMRQDLAALREVIEQLKAEAPPPEVERPALRLIKGGRDA